MAKVDFNGEGQELERITAKKDYASSMKHKISACAMFDGLHKYMGENFYPNLINEVNGNYAVEQYPFIAFQDIKLEGTNDYEQIFIGLYAAGADKGDKGYFGFNDPRVKDKAIRLEGTDHIKGVGFNYPWRVNGVRNIRYNHDKEALCIVTGEDKTKWTAILEQSYCGTAETEAEIEAYLEEKFMPIYELAYNNNPLLVGTSMNIDAINADVDAFGSLRRTDGRPYSYCEFWIDGEYDVYYLNQERNRYEKNGLNLYDVLSDEDKARVDAASTLDEKNKIFIRHRVNAFKAVAENYICIDDALFLIVFCLVIVASDNFEKNMYPYIMDFLLRFFNDDLDSIFSTDNQAQDTKKYSAELHDFTDDTMSAYVFKGEDNALFNLIEMAYPERLMKMGKDMLQSMYDLSKKGTKTLDRLNGYYDQTFFDKAQNYYPISAYNNDSEVSYLEAWNDKDYVASVDIHPLAQSLGNHYTTEKRFVNLRNVYLMSKFGFGGFASYEDNSLGVISVRTQKPVGFTLTPAIDMYPTILGGQAQVSKSDRRIKAGESVTLSAVGGGNTNVYIVAADYLTDIGDLKDLSIDPSSDVSLNVSSKRLRWLKLGDEDAAAVTSYLAGVNIQKCDSLETIDARNLVSLKGDIDLVNCPRLYAALFKGTSTKKVNVPVGSKIEVLTLPDTITTLVLNKLQNLTKEGLDFGSLGQLAYLRLESNKKLDGWDMMKTAQQNSDKLTHIRVIGFNKVGDATDVTLLKTLSEGKYHGIDAEGNNADTSLPIIEGKLHITGSVNGKDRDAFKINFPNLFFDADKFVNFIEFEDKEVLRVLLSNGVDKNGDGGITEEEAAAVTSIGTWFKENTTIQYFDELEKFTGVKTLDGTSFAGCTNLLSININNIENIATSVFYECSSLTGNFKLQNLIGTLGASAFRGTAITSFVAPNLLQVGGDNNNNGAFRNCSSLKSVSIPSVTIISQGAFLNCVSLESVDLRDVQRIHNYAFDNCISLSGDFNLPNLIETLGDGAFMGTAITSFSAPKLTTVAGTSNVNGGAFKNCKSLKTVSIPSVNRISYGAFLDCTSLESVELRDVQKIDNYAFDNCTSLKGDLNLPNLTGTLGEGAFRGTDITSFSAPKLTSIAGTSNGNGGAFKSCKSLKTVSVPSATRISYHAFGDCTALESIDMSSVVRIDARAFNNCTSLEIEDLSLPNLEVIDKDALYGVKIKKISNFGKLTALPTAASSTQNFGDKSVLEEVVLPDTITSIPSYSFCDYTVLNRIGLPNSITSINQDAFYGCSLLSIVVSLPNLTTIGARAFCQTGITRIENLGSITTIPNSNTGNDQNGCFTYCNSLVFARIPATCSMIGSGAFAYTSLNTLIVENTTPPTLGNRAIYDNPIADDAGFIYVPDESVTAYREASRWSEYADRIKPLSEYTE